MIVFNKYWVFFLTVFLLMFVREARSCTIFTATDGERVLFAGNEDQPRNVSYLVTNTTGHFGVLYFATESKKYDWLEMQMGINEMGLMYDLNWIPKEALIPEPDKIAQTQVWAVSKAMQQASSVDEVLDILFSHNWGDSIAYQLHFADSSGDAVIIHPGSNGKLTYTRIDKYKGYLVSTNFNPIKKKGWRWGLKRHQLAEAMLSELNSGSEINLEFMASVLDATHQNNSWFNNPKTLFSVVFDPKALKAYLYYERKFRKPYMLDVKAELAKTDGIDQLKLSELVATVEH